MTGRTTVRLNFDPGRFGVRDLSPEDGQRDHVVSIRSTSCSFCSSKLEIQHAVYGATDGAGEMDVTANWPEWCATANWRSRSAAMLSDSDPAILHAKELRVDYLLDGKPGHASANENEMLTLPANRNGWP
jgi:hypothetical protein